jgi:predicted alpha/beta-fold hydrolase
MLIRLASGISQSDSQNPQLQCRLSLSAIKWLWSCTGRSIWRRRTKITPLSPKNCLKNLVLIVHGLEGSVESSYVKGVCEKALNIGFSVCRVNLRNCGDTLHLARGLYNAGMSEDIVAIAADLKKRFGFERIFLSGFSLGGNIVLKAAGEQGRLLVL